jgi:nitrate reductase NapD
MTITSIVVKTRPEHLQDVTNGLKTVNLSEVHFRDELGRIVVTVECESQEEVMKKLKQIQLLPHVLSADLAFAYSEED